MVQRQQRGGPGPAEGRTLLALPYDPPRSPSNGEAARFNQTVDALLLDLSGDIQDWKDLGLSAEQRAAIGQVLLHAAETFGSAQKAARWLRRPNALLGAPPLEIIVHKPGDVDAELTRIDHGVYA